jgi:hypothetical protein
MDNCQDLPAGYSGTGRLNFKWSERGIHCCFLLKILFGSLDLIGG